MSSHPVQPSAGKKQLWQIKAIAAATGVLLAMALGLQFAIPQNQLALSHNVTVIEKNQAWATQSPARKQDSQN